MSFHSSPPLFEMEHMTENLATIKERRERPRFRVNLPLTVFVGDREIPAYTRDFSNLGVFFYLAPEDGTSIDCEFEFVAELPPEITHSTCICRIRCCASLVRREDTRKGLMGIGARVLDYSILREGMEFA
jgi:hypothetical protein